MAKTPTN